MNALPNHGHRGCADFAKIANAFLGREGLPFTELISAERIAEVFARHNNLFGSGAIYSTAVMVWSFLGQVLRDGKEASCQSAVARVVTYCLQSGKQPPTEDTGDYCKARAKLSEHALHELATDIAADLEKAADPSWLWKGLHAKLVDGFTFTMPDTAKNQAEYPQQCQQLPGCGFPIARAVAIVSLATACVIDLAFGPYQGKETGETALMRKILGRFGKGDIVVMDRYYCSFMMIAKLLGQDAQVCARKHHLRHTDFRRGKRLGKYDHLIKWTRPLRPSWMSQTQYEQIPKDLILREIRYWIVEKGRRTKSVTIITTLLDDQKFDKQEIADLYGFRWNAETDIGHIKTSLNLWHVRCMSPGMVRRELWTTVLAYNLIRTTAATAAAVHRKLPRQISFTGTCQYLLSSWMLHSIGASNEVRLDHELSVLLEHIARCEVANRPGRLEPRSIKRRPKQYPFMMKPRSVLRKQLAKQCT
ncbi:MAG: IS4 family transposase [Planctomycetota bacterium]